MVAYTIPGVITTPIGVQAFWATSWRGTVSPSLALTGNPADHQIDNEQILTAIAVEAIWGLNIGGNFQNLIARTVRVMGAIGVTNNGGGTADPRGFLAAGDNELETLVENPGGSLVQAFITGTPAFLGTPVAVTQNFDLFEIYGTREILPSISVLDGDFPLVDTRKSPALVLFNGTNYLSRVVDDAIFDGETNFSCAVLFDPELVEPGQNCVVVAKNNLSATQAGWKVEWNATTKLVTVTVYSSLNGADRVVRTTVATIVRRSILVWTYDSAGPTLHLHVNGALSEGAQVDTGTPGTMADSSEPLTVGAHETSTTPAAFMKGAVYLVALWDVTLSQSEAESIDAHGSLPTALQTGDLIAYWDPLGIDSNGTNDYFHGWLEEIGDFTLLGRATSGDVPRIMPGNTALDPFLLRNNWTVNFTDQSTIRTQNLNSTRVLSNDPPAPLRRIYNVIHTNPNIAGASNWRTQQCDLTFIAILYKGQTTNNITVFECYGLRCLFDRGTHTLTLVVGADSTATLQNDLYTFPPGGLTGFADNQIVVCVIKYNAVEDKAIAIVNGQRMIGSVAATNSFSNGTGLTIGDQIDYIAAIAIPACLSDAQIEKVLQGFQGQVYGFTYGFEAIDDVDNRWFPMVDQPGDLSAIQAFGQNRVARYTGNQAEPRTPPAPLPLLRIDQRSSLLPSVLFTSDDLLSFQYLDEPYHVQLGFGLDDPTVGTPIFIDPLPTIVSVTANVAHSVVAIANAGPTDAGQVATWWEVELISGSEEAVLVFDYNPANTFSVNHNHTDTFTIPVGINLDEKRIRFVIQAIADGEQVWKSLFFRMEGANFDNHEVEVIVTPGVPVPEQPTIDDLQVTITQSQLVLRRERDVPGITLNVSAASRYKLTRAFVDSARTRGVEFELMSVIEDFYTSGEEFRRHRITSVEIGFMDKLAVRFFGPGNEQMWWAIAYANAILDPETVQVGEELIIPSREAVRRFLARRPVATG